jgi:hypothetical protein
MREKNTTNKSYPVFMELVKHISEKKSPEYLKFYKLYKNKILEKYKSLVEQFEKFSLVLTKEVKMGDHLNDNLYFIDLSIEEKEMVFDKLVDDLSKIMYIRKYNFGSGKIVLNFRLCEYDSNCREKVLQMRKRILGKRIREDDEKQE